MGLDQYGYYKEPNGNGERIEIVEWRKHHALQQWMESLWLTRLADRSIEDKFLDALDDDNNSTDFNCVEIELDEHDIDSLENDLEELYEGEDADFISAYRRPLDQKFITEARELFKAGKQVFYDSWW